MIDKNWKYCSDKDGNFCLYHKNPTSGEWEVYKSIKKPKYKKNGKLKKSNNNCSIQ